MRDSCRSLVLLPAIIGTGRTQINGPTGPSDYPTGRRPGSRFGSFEAGIRYRLCAHRERYAPVVDRTPFRAISRARTPLLLVPAAALLVHQLRYTLGYGSRAGSELAAQGHSYLHSLVPWIVLALGVAASRFLRDVVAAARTGRGPVTTRSAPAQWVLATGVLFAVYTVQESLEGLFAAGHPGGAAGVLGQGGWWAIPASGAVAALVVVLLRLGRAAVRLAASRAPRRRRLAALPIVFPSLLPLRQPAPLALAAAGRAPPRR